MGVYGCGSKKMSGMRQKAASGVKWITISQAIRGIAQLLGLFILARLLPPSDFGLIAIATVFTGVASLFRDFGTAAAIIQKPQISAKLLDCVFWLNLLFGLGIALLLFLVSPLVAYSFAEPRLIHVLWMLALTFPISALGVVHQALLERKSDFRPLAIIESIIAFVCLAAAVWAARAGWGVFSLVLQTLLTAVMTTSGLWLISKWRPCFHWDAKEVRGVIGFSSNLVGFNLVNYFIRNADNLLVGRFLGATELGYYSMAYRLMLWPLQNISSVVGRALFPVFSNMQTERERLAIAYMRATAAIMLVTAPLMFGFFVLREPFVIVTLGDSWHPVVNVLAWLVPVGLLQTIGTLVGTLYQATGRTDLMFKWAIAAGLLVLPAFVIGLHWGIVGMAAAYAGASLILFWPGLALPFRLVGLRVSNVLLRLVPSVLAAFSMALLVAGASASWPANADNQLIRFIFLAILGVLTYGGLSLITQRTHLKEIMSVLLNR